MKALSRIGVALALAVCVAGCVTPGTPTVPSAMVTSPRIQVIPEDRIRDAVAIGKSTKGDVLAALGETLVVSFDSGFEVWVYQLAGARSGSKKPERGTAAEFVILFAPSGLVAKIRIRPAPPPKIEG